ncbi:paraslipin, partial [Shewanella sp. SR41-2]|nr:paraslipin [Shewanella sp. SR41-2]
MINGIDTDLIVMAIWGVIFAIFVLKLFQSICLVPTKSAYIVERLGKYHSTLDAGFHALIPFLDKVAYIHDLKEETIDVPPQECFSSDEVNVEVDGVIYISVTDPVKASYGITDYRYAAIQLAQTTTRSVIGTLDLDR